MLQTRRLAAALSRRGVAFDAECSPGASRGRGERPSNLREISWPRTTQCCSAGYPQVRAGVSLGAFRADAVLAGVGAAEGWDGGGKACGGRPTFPTITPELNEFF